ncbi:hypothetical protein KKD71_04935 [Patescibacteria group bacterium]|nr:hypothetical protein [Patescibacteria group bacterium]
MEEHLKSRPKKTPFTIEEQTRLRDSAIRKIQELMLPDDKIIKIVLIGSSVKGHFGEYEPPGFRGSLFSDFDFIIFVSNDYKIPEWLKREPDGKPFADNALNLAYRARNFVEDKYDAEVFFVRESSTQDQKICELGEEAGIPMTEQSKHPHLVV